MRTEAEVYDDGPQGYEGPVCPACGKIAYYHQAGHTVGCEFGRAS